MACYCIGVGGQSGSGKSYICDKIIEKISGKYCAKSITIINQDKYYRGGNSETNYDIIDAVDFDLMVKQIKMLIRGEAIECPQYDFATHQRKKETSTIFPTKIILIEGILIFSIEELRKLCDLKIFINAHTSTCLLRRIERDIGERGRTLGEVRSRYEKHVMPSIIQYVEPSSHHADIAIKNENDTYIGLEVVLYYIEKKIEEHCIQN